MSARSLAKRDGEGDLSPENVTFAEEMSSLSLPPPAVRSTTPAVRKAAGSAGRDSSAVDNTAVDNTSGPRSRKRKSIGPASTMPEEKLLRRVIRFKNVVVTNITRKRIPVLGRAMDGFQRAPHHVRALVFVAFVLWKFIMTFVVLPLLFKFAFTTGYGLLRMEELTDIDSSTTLSFAEAASDQEILRVLYVVAAQSNLSVPVLQDGVESMIASPYSYHVDVYLLLGYRLESKDKDTVFKCLPDGVGLQVWDDALPPFHISGDSRGSPDDFMKSLALLRQQRFIVRDKITSYDFFVVFEGSTRITGAHVAYFLEMSKELDNLQRHAPLRFQTGLSTKQGARHEMSTLIPGFLEVEVLADGDKKLPMTDDKVSPTFTDRRVDPKLCCHISDADDIKIPSAPTSDSLVVWEPATLSSVRRLSSNSMLDRVFVQPGPFPFTANVSDFVARSGGWMATREQLLTLRDRQCDIFPGYDGSKGAKQRAQAGCSVERTVSLHPDHFSKHLVYHTANNKHKDPMVIPKVMKVDSFYDQLNSFVKEDSREFLAEQR